MTPSYLQSLARANLVLPSRAIEFLRRTPPLKSLVKRGNLDALTPSRMTLQNQEIFPKGMPMALVLFDQLQKEREEQHRLRIRGVLLDYFLLS